MLCWNGSDRQSSEILCCQPLLHSWSRVGQQTKKLFNGFQQVSYVRGIYIIYKDFRNDFIFLFWHVLGVPQGGSTLFHYHQCILSIILPSCRDGLNLWSLNPYILYTTCWFCDQRNTKCSRDSNLFDCHWCRHFACLQIHRHLPEQPN